MRRVENRLFCRHGEYFMQKTQIEEQFSTLCGQVTEQLGLLLYDIDYRPTQSKLIVYIMNDQTDTADIKDCVKVNEVLTARIETEDWIPKNLFLEVSSPGVPRKLKWPWHFKRVCGKKVKLRLFNGNVIEGNLLNADEKEIKIEEKEAVLRLDYKNIKKAQLHFVL